MPPEIGEKVLLTHIVNPHLFWYCRLCDLKICAKELHEIETALKSEYLSKDVNKYQRYEDKAKVIVEYLPMQKFIRAQILQLIEPSAQQMGEKAAQHYIVWAMDYGFPIETSAAFMMPLPLELSKSLLHILRGGLAYLVPGKQSDCSSDEMEEYLVGWQDEPCRNFEMEINEAKSITFDVSFQTVFGQNFGLLYMSDGDKTSTAAAGLIASGFARFAKTNFKEFYTKLQPPNMNSWLTNDGKPNTESNSAEMFESARCRPIDDLIVAFISKNSMSAAAGSLQTEVHKSEDTNFKLRIGNIPRKQPAAVVEKVQEDNNTQCEYPVENTYTRYRRKIDQLTNPVEASKSLDKILRKYDKSKPLAASSFSQETSNCSALKPAKKPPQESPQKPPQEQPKKTPPKEHKINQRKMNKLNKLLHKITTVPTPTPTSTSTPNRNADATVLSKTSATALCTTDSLNMTFDDFNQQQQQQRSETSSLTSSTSSKLTATVSSLNSSYKSAVDHDKVDTEAAVDKACNTSSKSAESEASTSPSNSSYKSLKSATKAEQTKDEFTENTMTLEQYIQQKMSSQTAKCVVTSSSNTRRLQLFGSNSSKAQQHAFDKSVEALKQDATQPERLDYVSSNSRSIKPDLRSTLFNDRQSGNRMATPPESAQKLSEVDAHFRKKLDDILEKYEFEEKLAKVLAAKPSMPLKQRPQHYRFENCLVTEGKRQQLHDKTTEDIVMNFGDHMLLAHAAAPLQTIAQNNEEYFTKNVYAAMRQKKLDQPYPLQRYAWSHLLHGNERQSLVVISGAKTGRTWSYLPALCSLVYRKLMLEKAKSGSGAIAVVLVAKARQAQSVTEICSRLMQDKNMKMETVVGAYDGGRKNTEVRINLYSGCGILVATPTHLLELLRQYQSEEIFDATRLAHIVIDDIDLIHELDATACKSLIGQLLKLCTLQRGQLGAQLVMTSQHWNASYMPWFVRHAHAPLLLFGDFLEAAVYDCVDLQVNMFGASSEKLQRLLNFLSDRASQGRTVIFCTDEEEILKLAQALHKAGYDCLPYLPRLDAQVQQRVIKWKTMPNKQLLLCLDKVMELNVQNAEYLIHYSLPNSWTKFKMRFSTIARNFANQLPSKGKSAVGPSKSTHVLVLVDEGNVVELPHLVKFLILHKQKVDPKVVELARQCQREQEKARISKSYAICSELACHGECTAMEDGCGYRHVLTAQDAVQEAQRQDVPCFGAIRVELLKVYTPGHFAVRLLEHRANPKQNWRILPQKAQHARLNFALAMHFVSTSNRQQHLSPVVHDVCVLLIDKQYQRVRILNVIPDQTSVQATVTVRYVDLVNLDNNTDIIRRKAADLLVCPAQLLAVPPLAIDVRLTGIVPENGERSWSPAATKFVEQELQNANNANGKKIECIVDFSLAHTIFINNLIVMELLPTICTDIYKVTLTKLLVKNHFGKGDKEAVQKLHSWASEVIDLKQQALESEPTQHNTVENKQKNNSHEDGDESINKRIDASMEQLEIDDTLAVAAPSAATNIGEIDTTMPAAVPSNAAKQTETWCTLPLNTVIKIDIGHSKENGLWAGFLALNMSEESYVAFEQLQQRITRHMSTEQPKCIADLRQVKSGDNFILLYNDEFVRAKLLVVEAIRFFRFLLLDHGFVVNLSPHHFKQPILYPITEELVDALPYQTIFCKLTGVNLQPAAMHVKSSGRHLYAVAKRECKKPVFRVTKMHAYEILLYETNPSDELHKASLFNKRLIELGVASADAQTSGDLNAAITDFIEVHGPEPDPEPVISGLAQLERTIMNILKFEEDEQEPAKLFFQQMFCLSEVEPNTVTGESSKVASKATNSQVTTQKLPQTLAMLGSKCRQPQVCWYQTTSFIQLNIVAQEEAKYVAMCDGARLFYSTLASEHMEAFHLHLCGYVRNVSHEKRGLNVVIKLLKSNCGYWPSLLKAKPNGEKTYKLNWLKHNLDHAKTPSAELSDAQKTLLMQSRLDAGLNQDNWNDESDNDDDDCTISSNNRNGWQYDVEFIDGHEHSNEFPLC